MIGTTKVKYTVFKSIISIFLTNAICFYSPLPLTLSAQENNRDISLHSTLSPQINLDITSLQKAFSDFFTLRVLLDETNAVLKKTLYSDINAFRTVIINSPPTPDFLNSLLENTPGDTLPLPWTVDEIKTFSVYLPSVVHKLKESIGAENLFELTGVNGVSDEDRILRSIFQLQTELSQRIATLDSYIVENRGNYKTFLNKIYVYNRITAMFLALGLLERKDARFMSHKIAQDKGIDLLIEIKKRLIEYLEILPLAFKEPKKRTFKALLTPEEHIRYGYVDWVKEKLGDNLAAIVLYGSATREEENFSDFDNWVVVKDIDKAYKELRGAAITLKDGKVLVKGKEGKEVSLNIIPESVYAKIFHFNAVCDRHIDHCKVLYGSVEVYDISEKEIIERSISSVYLRLKTLRAAALWIARAPEEIVGKIALFKYFIKNTQFVMNVCINHIEGLRIVSKQEIERRLKEIGIKLFEYKPEQGYIARAMIQTAVDSSLLHRKYLADRIPEFSFLDFEAIEPKIRDRMLKALRKNRKSDKQFGEVNILFTGRRIYRVDEAITHRDESKMLIRKELLPAPFLSEIPILQSI